MAGMVQAKEGVEMIDSYEFDIERIMTRGEYICHTN